MRGVLVLLMMGVVLPVHAALPNCADMIAKRYQIPVPVLAAIHEVEGGRDGLVVRNTNGSTDGGRMQINSWWNDKLARYGITRSDVVNNGCTNLAVAAWILRQEVDRFHDWFQAFAAYNAGDGNRRAGYGYARKVVAAMRRQ